MHIARQNFLAGAGFARDQHGGFAGGDLLGKLHHARGGVVAIDQIAAVIGDGGEHGGDQLGVRRQRDVFLGAGMDRGDRGAGVGRGAAGDDRGMDAFGLERRDQSADVDRDIDHQQVGAAARAQHGERLAAVRGVGDERALVHRDLGRGGELAIECADDQKAHEVSPVLCLVHATARRGRKVCLAPRVTLHDQRSALMISVMVTPSFSSTSTTSPRATRRLLT